MNRPSKVAAALFDLDGVLVDSRIPIARSINYALERNGIPPRAEADLYALIGPPLHDAFAELLGSPSPGSELIAACVASYRERYEWACIEETVAFEGIAASVRILADRMPLAVATSKPGEFAGPILEHLELADAFQSVVGPALDSPSEPKARTVARALAALAVPGAGEIVMVGDRRHDVVAGRTNHLTTVGVTWGIGSRDELRAAGADYLVEDAAELVRLLGGEDSS